MSLHAATHKRSTSSASVPTIAISDDGDTSTIKGGSSSPTTSPQPSDNNDSNTTMISRTSTAFSTVVAGPPPPPRLQAIYHDTPLTPTSPTSARPGTPAYFPMRHYVVRPVAPGTVLAAPPLKPSQLACFAGHYRFLAARNESHPLACATCTVADNAMRYACSHCHVRLCKACCDVLMINGRDLGKLVEMLKA